jgi:translation initiation factor IF-2
MTDTKNKNEITRSPVIAIMGHIDHGKSTLLDFIRKTNIVEKEAGGITQHIGAYEVTHVGKDGKEHKITFLDTPGHEAFSAIRKRGATVADVGVLVVSAEDGVKPQTLEAFECMKKDSLPFVVAINKIDRPGADVERTKQSLAEHEIFLEGFGGHVSWIALSAKTGEGVPELLDLLLLAAELEELRGDPTLSGEGVIIESNLDAKKGITTTAIIKQGTVRKGEFAVSGKSLTPLRILEDFQSKPIGQASFSSPIKIIGWDTLPKVGEKFYCFKEKAKAVEFKENYQEGSLAKEAVSQEDGLHVIPIIIKADTAGSLDALVYEIGKIKSDRVRIKIILSGIGPISENDVKSAGINNNALVIGFHTKVETGAQNLALRTGVQVNAFDIIYKLTEWLESTVKENTPSIEVEEVSGNAKILKIFSKIKNKQIVGGRVESGELLVNAPVKIMRRDAEIGRGHVRELQSQKQKTSTVAEGNEFGAMIESKTEIAPGDKIEVFSVVNR